MPCAEQDLLRQKHRTAVQNFRAAIRDLVLLVDNSATDSNFNLGHRRIGLLAAPAKRHETPSSSTKKSMDAEIQSAHP